MWRLLQDRQPPDQPYLYYLTASDIHGNESARALLEPDGEEAVSTELPRVVLLDRPYPNPARGSSHIGLALPRAADVTLAIYDASGRLVRTIVQRREAAGAHAYEWNLRDGRNRSVASGIYFVRLDADKRTLIRRLAILE